jgi:hypothetical protein
MTDPRTIAVIYAGETNVLLILFTDVGAVYETVQISQRLCVWFNHNWITMRGDSCE